MKKNYELKFTVIWLWVYCVSSIQLGEEYVKIWTSSVSSHKHTLWYDFETEDMSDR